MLPEQLQAEERPGNLKSQKSMGFFTFFSFSSLFPFPHTYLHFFLSIHIFYTSSFLPPPSISLPSSHSPIWTFIIFSPCLLSISAPSKTFTSLYYIFHLDFYTLLNFSSYCTSISLFSISPLSSLPPSVSSPISLTPFLTIKISLLPLLFRISFSLFLFTSFQHFLAHSPSLLSLVFSHPIAFLSNLVLIFSIFPSFLVIYSGVLPFILNTYLMYLSCIFSIFSHSL